jgi:hypothetical protein
MLLRVVGFEPEASASCSRTFPVTLRLPSFLFFFIFLFFIDKGLIHRKNKKKYTPQRVEGVFANKNYKFDHGCFNRSIKIQAILVITGKWLYDRITKWRVLRPPTFLDKL